MPSPTRPRLFAVGGAILGNVVDGYGVVAVAFIGKAIEQAWNLDPAMLGLIFAAGPAGMMLGSLALAPFADRFGRRRISLTALLLVALGMFGAAAAATITQLLAMLLLTGLGIGGVLATLNTVVAEIAPPDRRNSVMALFSAGYPLGSTLAGGLAIGLMATHGWQIVFLLGGALSFLVFLVNVFTLPESANDAAGGNRAAPDRRSALLFGPGQRGQTLTICLIFFLNMISFYFILLWTARLSSGPGLPETTGASAMTIVNIGSLLGPLLFGLLADRFGLPRITRLYFAGFAGAIALFAVAGGAPWSLYAAAALVGMAMSGAMTSLYASTPLLFTAQVRAAGTGLAIGIGRLGATLGPFLAGLALQMGVGRPGLYCLFAIPPLLVVLILMTGQITPTPTLKAREA